MQTLMTGAKWFKECWFTKCTILTNLYENYYPKHYYTCPNLSMNESRTRPRLSSLLHEIRKLLQHQVLLCKFSQINWDRINLLLSADIAKCYRVSVWYRIKPLTLWASDTFKSLDFCVCCVVIAISVERCGPTINLEMSPEVNVKVKVTKNGTYHSAIPRGINTPNLGFLH